MADQKKKSTKKKYYSVLLKIHEWLNHAKNQNKFCFSLFFLEYTAGTDIQVPWYLERCINGLKA